MANGGRDLAQLQSDIIGVGGHRFKLDDDGGGGGETAAASLEGKRLSQATQGWSTGDQEPPMKAPLGADSESKTTERMLMPM